MIRLSPTATLFHADCRDAIASLPDNSVDSVVTDPPYELNFMGKGWDNTGIANDVALWKDVLRVLKPGGHLAAFSASRTYHRMACAIEDAGFEIRDSLMWVYGTGFPKSLDVSKAIDKLDAADARRERQLRFTAWMRASGLTTALIDGLTNTNMGGHYTTAASQPAVATREHFEKLRPYFGCDVPDWIEQMVDERTVESENFKARAVVATLEMRNTSEVRLAVTAHADDYDPSARRSVDITTSHTTEAAEWEGWGTALKPAFEPIVLARKPLSEGTVAANVIKWRTGALNIDASRIHTAGSEAKAYTVKRLKPGATLAAEGGNWRPDGDDAETYEGSTKDGRWPANIVHDGSDEVIEAFPANAGAAAPASGKSLRGENTSIARGKFNGLQEGREPAFHADKGSAARFFYSAKASRADRNGSKHPTVKPIALMEWLCNLITPPGGTVLDPFGGSGTTARAASNKGFGVLICEREAEYVADIRARFGTVGLDLAPLLARAATVDAVWAELARA